MLSVGDPKENKSTKNFPHRNNSSKKALPKLKEHKNQYISNNGCESLDLLTSMTQRLSVLEAELEHARKDLKEAKKTIKEKDYCISKLIRNIDKSKNPLIRDKHSFDLPYEFYKLQSKVLDMEKFLYESCHLQAEKVSRIDASNKDNEQMNAEYQPDLDNIIEIIHNLNLDNSEPQVQYTELGARLQMCDVVELTLYANGMISGTTPFRPYSNWTVQAFFQDLHDGFYPAELQEDNPQGVIFKVCDKRFEEYKPARKKFEVFGGLGKQVGTDYFKEKQNCDFNSIWQPLISVVDDKRLAIKDSGFTEFGGKLQLDYKAVPELCEKTQSIVVNAPTNRKNEIKLKVKGFHGQPVYILHVLKQDTVSTLHNLLSIDGDYMLAYRDDFNKVHYLTLNQATLTSYGICQSCVLFVAKQ